MVSSTSIAFLLFLLPLGLDCATLTIRNECSNTVWPGFLAANGNSLFSTTGFSLMPGESKVNLTLPNRLWARTFCSKDITGKFHCVSGDCGTSTVECGGGIPTPPVTVVDFDGTGDLNLYNISLVGGFNVPVTVSTSGRSCSATGCLTDLKACPIKLRVIWKGVTVACKINSNRTEPCSSVYIDNNASFPCSSSNYTVTFCGSSKSLKKGDKKEGHLGKKLLKYTGFFAVICVICGFIIFQIRIRLSNSGWEVNVIAGIIRG